MSIWKAALYGDVYLYSGRHLKTELESPNFMIRGEQRLPFVMLQAYD